MNIYELFKRNPKTANLVNDGQARIDSKFRSDQEFSTLRYELENFVCQGKYEKGMQQILDSFLTNLNLNNQQAAWISGFYGSGKSHLLKMLCHLWANTTFPNKAKARLLTPDLTEEILASLRELDNQGRRSGGGVFAASGTMTEGGSGNARRTVLGILFRACGFPEAFNQAKFCLFLHSNGYCKKFKSSIKAAKKDFEHELSHLFVSPLIRKALLECDPALGNDGNVIELLRNQFPDKMQPSSDEFIKTAKEVLRIKGKGKIPLTLLVIDEVQHYIGEHKDRSTEIAEMAEIINKEMENRVMLVASGQNALNQKTPQLEKLVGRFTIQIALSDLDVKKVTRKVLLAKKPEAIEKIREVLGNHSGEIATHLEGSNLKISDDDRKWLEHDYPILPTRWGFWEAALRAIDSSESVSQLRNHLRITHEALHKAAEKKIGYVIPADFMFFQQQAFLVSQNILMRDISDRITRLYDDSPDGRLRARICGLIFLIRRLPREKDSDMGLRANEKMIGDLLIEDLSPKGTTDLREQLGGHLKALVDSAHLLFDGKEYNLQTREASEWEHLFKEEMKKVKNDFKVMEDERISHLEKKVKEAIRPLRLQQGMSKIPRKYSLNFGQDRFDDDEKKSKEIRKEIPFRILDGWKIDEDQAKNKVREGGTESPDLFIFLPKSPEDIEKRIAEMKAAEAVIRRKGEPNSNEAKEAREAMITRGKDAEKRIGEIVEEVLSKARVFKSGGTEIDELSILEKVREGAQSSMDRLFLRFSEADHHAWNVVIQRAQQGDGEPLSAVDWKKDAKEHPVCKEILRQISSRKTGQWLRDHFSKPHFGWHQDAVDGALLALYSASEINVKNANTSESIEIRNLDQKRIQGSTFETESDVITPQQKIALRGMFQNINTIFGSKMSLERASEFLDCFISFGNASGGEAPLPDPPSTKHIDDLKMLSGNKQLLAILSEKERMEMQARDWKKQADLAEARLQDWEKLQSLLGFGSEEEMKCIRTSANAILKDRLLLEPDDHCKPLIKDATEMLRVKLNQLQGDFSKTQKDELARLTSDENWQKLGSPHREKLFQKSGILENETLPQSTEELIAGLNRAPFSHRQVRIDALPQQVNSLLKKAAEYFEPKAKFISLPSAMIKDKDELERWLGNVRGKIEEKLGEGPVIV